MDSMNDIEDNAFLSFLHLVQEIARVHPHKRRRWKRLRKDHTILWDRILDNNHFDWLRDEEQFTVNRAFDEIDCCIDSDQINKLLQELAYDGQAEYEGDATTFEAW